MEMSKKQRGKGMLVVTVQQIEFSASGCDVQQMECSRQGGLNDRVKLRFSASVSHVVLWCNG